MRDVESAESFLNIALARELLVEKQTDGNWYVIADFGCPNGDDWQLPTNCGSFRRFVRAYESKREAENHRDRLTKALNRVARAFTSPSEKAVF